MKASEIRAKYLKFFASRGHAVIPAAPIIPPDDPTTLFTSSGMQQMVPYLKGTVHPMGKRIVDSQPSFRSDDIEEVGDNRHTCMFEMLGNWSLGDYFKQEQLSWIWEFFTGELGLPAEKLYITLFEGNELVPKDLESYDIWKSLGVKDDHIVYYPGKKNWWSRAGTPDQMPVGEIGGPTSEIFFEFTGVVHDKKFGDICHPNCDCGRFLEICNSVFMAYEKIERGLKSLPSQNVDFGGGLERIAAAVNNDPDIFMTDMFTSIIRIIEVSSGKKYEGQYLAPMRVIADHLRASVFMIAQGLEPSNKLQGYILRRLLRRAAVRSRLLGADAKKIFIECILEIVKEYSEAGFIGADSSQHVQTIITDELDKFSKALDRGLKEINHTDTKLIDAQFAFNLYQSLGFPFEITRDLLAEKNITLDQSELDKIFTAHKEGSRTASAGMFKGGLADQGEITTKYHTATHLLHQALIDVLGDEIQQAGSNITSERLRFDYAFSGKPTATQLKKISEIINAKISEDLPVVKTIEDKDKAINSGARAFFSEKYPEKVSVYTIGTYSKELCGGPHVESTGVIGKIEIYKDEALGSGKRRIYAKL
ncbi:alanine--tRNA ligase [Candidatus Collierbacteria bacterium CG10_big_fil_rev_8_21_14_0_10_44_9]|uniref:alanine--tRNA ligase n=1 Tax=Candidatus Collierbacteria bacterium CG10_big_fil_rev_8_21_14_0_10_44_9 TaxID=1974535 RepID=A0A2H0VIZ6_9BACT|nr:MAG: alanine--tRNA ligase [Candidatus Collierbacteria bacterium CG10_big_fil_rev_8_21_14_0_10_44_9]